MSSKTPIFFIGATGYIGGAVLSRLVSHPNADTFGITAIVRSEEKSKKIELFGVKTVVGSFKTDLDLVVSLAQAAHIVFHCADSDDVACANAILKGLKNRHTETGDIPVLIHTSGTGTLTYVGLTKGLSATDTIYDDADPEQMMGIDPRAWHRNVDLPLVQADQAGYVRTHIILPSTIYGIASHPLVSAGVANSISIQIPILIRAALDRGRAGMVGTGVPFWPSVHIDDNTDMYITLFDAILANSERVGHGVDGWYFGVNGEHTWYEISKAIGKAMVELGLCDDDEPTSFTDEELVKYFGTIEMGYYWGSNSRARANHSRAIGWNPNYTTKDMSASIKPQVEWIINKEQSGSSQLSPSQQWLLNQNAETK